MPIYLGYAAAYAHSARPSRIAVRYSRHLRAIDQKNSTASPAEAYSPIHFVAHATPIVIPHSPRVISDFAKSRPLVQRIWKYRNMKKYISMIQNTA